MESLNQAVSAHIGIIVVAAGVLAVAALVIALANVSRVAGVTRRFEWVKGTSSQGADSLATLLEALENNARDITALEERLGRAVEEGRTHLKRIGLIRYDAFDGVAGQQSYSLCMLDEGRNGVVLSSLVGSSFSRSYAVEVRGGEPSRKLGDEEAQALSLALSDSRAA